MPDAASPRILLADDHTLIRDALLATIRKQIPGVQFAKVSSSPEVEAAVAKDPWDLVVLDLGLPGDGELGTLRRLRKLRPAMPILIFSMFSEEKMGVSALEAGANGYLCKTADRAAITEAVVATMSGRGYVSVKLQELRMARRSELSALSPRELEVLLALGRGKSNKEIAAQLAIATTSVTTYRTRILEKLHLKTTSDLVRYVVERRLERG